MCVRDVAAIDALRVGRRARAWARAARACGSRPSRSPQRAAREGVPRGQRSREPDECDRHAADQPEGRGRVLAVHRAAATPTARGVAGCGAQDPRDHAPPSLHRHRQGRLSADRLDQARGRDAHGGTAARAGDREHGAQSPIAPPVPPGEPVRDPPLCCRCDACWRSCARRRRTTEKAGWVEARHAGELTPGLVARVRAAIATTMMMRMRARAAARAVEAPALH